MEIQSSIGVSHSILFFFLSTPALLRAPPKEKTKQHFKDDSLAYQ